MATKGAPDLTVYAALTDDISGGHVWLKDQTLPARCIVKITYTSNRRSVYCEALQFDDNFLHAYKSAKTTLEIKDRESSIVMSYWYRAKLKIPKTNSPYPLTIAKAKPVWGHLWACMQHPQVVVRVAVILGGIGVILSAIGAAPIIYDWARGLAGIACRAACS